MKTMKKITFFIAVLLISFQAKSQILRGNTLEMSLELDTLVSDTFIYEMGARPLLMKGGKATIEYEYYNIDDSASIEIGQSLYGDGYSLLREADTLTLADSTVINGTRNRAAQGTVASKQFTIDAPSGYIIFKISNFGTNTGTLNIRVKNHE